MKRSIIKSLIKATSQLGVLFIFAFAAWFFSWELLMADKQRWELTVTKSESRFLQGTYSSELRCKQAKIKLPGEQSLCRRVDGPHGVLNTIVDILFPFE